MIPSPLTTPASPASSAPAELAKSFRRDLARHAQRLRGALAARWALGGAALGSALAGGVTAGFWLSTRHLELRLPLAAAIVGCCAAAGLLRGRRQAWSDAKVALFLDRELEAHEHIVTAEEQLRSGNADAAVLEPALSALSRGTPTPRVVLRRHAPQSAALALGLALVLTFMLLPVRRAIATPPPVGAGAFQTNTTPGLDKVIALANAPPRDEAERERLAKIANDAEKLKADLLKGMEQREALDRVAKLEEALEQERLSLGAGEKRQGLEAAQAKLDEQSVTKKAAQALGDHDLQSLDAEMERIANSQEAEDRKAAKKALEEAIAAAKKNGAKDVAKALQEQKDRFEEREKRAALLRELESALRGQPGDAERKSDRESLDRKGSDEAARKLGDAMAKALEKMTPEERKKLAENMAKLAQKGGNGSGADPGAEKDLAKKLGTPEGQRELEDQLKDLAKQDLESPEAKKDGALDDAQGGLGDTKKQLGGIVPMPGAPGPGNGMPGGNDGKGPPGSGSHHDTGTGDHNGATQPIAGDTLRSRAKGPTNRGAPMPGTVTMWSEGKPGGTAVTPRTGDLRAAGATELDGVERSDVPTEYREQLRQYFQP